MNQSDWDHVGAGRRDLGGQAKTRLLFTSPNNTAVKL
jgi:hypothetical protein